VGLDPTLPVIGLPELSRAARGRATRFQRSVLRRPNPCSPPRLRLWFHNNYYANRTISRPKRGPASSCRKMSLII
jgi:hypothetical protein